jgi:hypothetical protein
MAAKESPLSVPKLESKDLRGEIRPTGGWIFRYECRLVVDHRFVHADGGQAVGEWVTHQTWPRDWNADRHWYPAFTRKGAQRAIRKQLKRRLRTRQLAARVEVVR